MIVLIAVLLSSIKIIQPWERGLVMMFGTYRGSLGPGVNVVPPIVSTVVRVDLRTQEREVPAQEVEMRNGLRVTVDGVIYLRVFDPERAYFEVSDYKIAVVALAQTVLKAHLAELYPRDLVVNRQRENERIRDTINEATQAWGVSVMALELRRFESGGRDLWKELATPDFLAGIKMRAGSPRGP